MKSEYSEEIKIHDTNEQIMNLDILKLGTKLLKMRMDKH